MINELLAARFQMALSLGFHIVFASVGMAMPFFMATSHWFYLTKKDELDLTLTQAWSKGVAIFFAVGAVSGTALSFELGLLWPHFMEYAGPIIGMPFSWEGTAFFLEAIALGIFLYGWNRVHPWMHWLSGLIVGIMGVASGFFVICANGWMNSPSGFEWNNGHPIHIDPVKAMFNDAALIQGVHMIVAAFEAVGFAVAGLHSFLWLKTRHRLHARAVKISFVFAAIAALIQPIIGDMAAKSVARRQPVKLAAMESLFFTQKPAPLLIGGIPDQKTRQVKAAIEIPAALSFLAFGRFDAEVKGLVEFPENEWPPVLVTHVAFQVMVGLGSILAMIAIIGLYGYRQHTCIFFSKKFQWLLVLCAPFGFIALEAGWIVTETGRQPWIIYGLLKTADALTPRPGIIYSLILYAIIYIFLSLMMFFLLTRQIAALHSRLSFPSLAKKDNI